MQKKLLYSCLQYTKLTPEKYSVFRGLLKQFEEIFRPIKIISRHGKLIYSIEHVLSLLQLQIFRTIYNGSYIHFLIPPLNISKYSLIAPENIIKKTKQVSGNFQQPLTIYLLCGGKDMTAIEWLPFLSRFLAYTISQVNNTIMGALMNNSSNDERENSESSTKSNTNHLSSTKSTDKNQSSNKSTDKNQSSPKSTYGSDKESKFN